MTTVTAEQRDEARFQERVATSYHEWLTYLTAQLTLLEVQADRTRVAFERADAREDEERAARARLAAISPLQRALFDAVYEQERQEVQHQLEQEQREAKQSSRHIDPDEVGRLALLNLQNDAKGIGTENGRGLLPRGRPDEIKWYRVDVGALTAAPNAATYAVGGDADGDRKRVVRTVGIGAAAILLVLVWMFLPRGATNQASATAIGVTANGLAVTPWPIVALNLMAGESLPRTLAVESTVAGVWPSSDDATSRAFWRAGSVLPIRLCVPEDALAGVTALVLPGAGDLPARKFALSESAGTAADLVVEPCERGSTTAARYGTLRAALSAHTFAVGETASLSNEERVTVAGITLTGAGEDPALPADQSRVMVEIQTPDTHDWPALAPTLVLPSGARLLPSETIATEQGVELRYLVPQPAQPLEVVWSLTPAPQQPALRWRATLEPPPARDAVLRDALDVRSVTAVRGASPGTYDVQIRVANRSGTPLTLTPNDISLSAQDRPLAAPDLAALRGALAPGEERTLVLVAPAQGRLILRVGTVRYTIGE